MSIEITPEPATLNVGGDHVAAADPAAARPQPEALREDPASAAGPKAGVFVDGVRASIVARHREFQAAKQDASLNAARDESARIAGGTNSGDGEAGAGRADSLGSGGAGVDSGAPAPASLEMVRVKVYGNEYDVPKSVVDEHGGVEAFQKTAAADVQLRRASVAAQRAVSLANDMEARTKQVTMPAASGSAPAGPPSGDSAGASTALKDEGRELLEAMLESDPDRIAAALGKAISKARPSNAGPVAANAAPSARLERDVTEIVTANAVFDTEFKGIRQNPAVMNVARNMMRERMANPVFDGTPLPDLARQIGAEIAAAFPTRAAPNPGSGVDVDSTLKLREAAKRQLPMTRTAQTLSGAPPQGKPDLSREQKQQSFVQMLRARSGSNSAIAEQRANSQR